MSKPLSVPTIPDGRMPNGQFAKGNHPVRYEADWLRAVRAVEIRQKKSFMEHAVERGFKSDKVLPHVLDRVVPVSKNVEAPTTVVYQIVQFVNPPDPSNGHPS